LWIASLVWSRGNQRWQACPAERSQDEIAARTWPFLFVSTYLYGALDDIGFPSTQQYDQISKFESIVLDRLDASGKGVLTIIETCSGAIGYFYYVGDTDDAGDFLNALILDDDPVEMAAAEDPSWEEYNTRMEQMKVS